MTCPSSETLSRWSDGTLKAGEAAAVDRHLGECPECRAKARALRAAGRWVESVAEPGEGCLTPEEMASVLAGGPVPSHVADCPRCAAELADLRPPRRRRRLLRFEPSSVRRTAWIASAAAVVLVMAGLVVLTRPRTGPPKGAREARAPETEGPGREPVVPVQVPEVSRPPETVPPAPAVSKIPEPLREERPPADFPPGPSKAESPSTGPVPIPEPVPGPERPTVAEAPRPREAAMTVRSGNFRVGGARATVIPEGVPARAEGRTGVEFAGARVILENGACISASGAAMTLLEGGLSACISPGAGFVLCLDEFRIVPWSGSSRVLLSAAKGRVVIEEGAARCGAQLLAEGVEHQAKGGRLEPLRGRTLPPALRPRETPVWRLDLANRNVTRGKLPRGKVVMTPFGPALAATPFEDEFFFGGIQYSWGGETEIFTLQSTTAFRFRYLLKGASSFGFVVRNRTKDESFGIRMDGVEGHWTTATVRVLDIPVKPGGVRVAAEPGDRYGWFGWNVGRPGEPAELWVDRIEVLEIEP